MTAVVALLRGVNVGGHRKVPSADLRAVAEQAGFTDVVTLLNSGNVVVVAPEALVDDAPHLATAQVSAAINAGILSRLGLDVHVVAVSAAALDEAVAANPFPEAARSDPSHLLVTFGADPPDEERIRAFDHSAFPEKLAWVGGVGYTYFPQGVGTSRLTPAVLKRELGTDGTEGTSRNWNTVLKLQALAAARA
ncbi:DUF1697 domain-containing protein [Sanguibacter sp. 25GB23B1]|uniref:DUF1697 domain-containing protein n=1 Tax=unclassified Sanguibacter TaxID=2645534 RepID=UPI0032B00746